MRDINAGYAVAKYEQSSMARSSSGRRAGRSARMAALIVLAAGVLTAVSSSTWAAEAGSKTRPDSKAARQAKGSDSARGSWAAPHRTGPRLALVIGNARYANAPLANPVNDARAMKAKLEKLGFQVEMLLDATLKDMKRSIVDFGDRLVPNSVAVLYYAGHGLQVKGSNFLVPVDARVVNENSIYAESLDLTSVLNQFNRDDLTSVVILDACRDNPFPSVSRSLSRGLAQVGAAPKGMLIAYSTAPGSVAMDGTGKNGLYTTELLAAMDQPGQRIEDVFKQVRARVAKVSNNKQIPWENSSLTGDLFLIQPEVGPGSAIVESVTRLENSVTTGPGHYFVGNAAAVFLQPDPTSMRVTEIAGGSVIEIVEVRDEAWGLVKLDQGNAYVDLSGLAPVGQEELRLWQQISASRELEKIRAFVNRFPNSPLAAKVMARLEALQARQDDAPSLNAQDREELAFWKKVQSSRDLRDLREYRRRWPNGKFERESWDLLVELSTRRP